MIFEYQNRKVFYEDRGKGDVVIFLHGWGCDHKIFDSITTPLSLTHRVIAIDFPGFGESEEPDSVWGVEDYTRCFEAFCRNLGITGPNLVGHSFGGRVSILFASRNETGRIVLADAAGVKPRRSLKYYIKVYSYKLAKWFILNVLHDENRMEAYRAKSGSSDYRNASPRMKAILSKVVNEDLKAEMPKIKAPTVLFWGTEDKATPMRDARIMDSLIPDTGLITVPGAGHFAFLENRGMFLSVLQNFFK